MEGVIVLLQKQIDLGLNMVFVVENRVAPFSIHHLSLVTWGLEGKTKTLVESFMVKYPNINTRFCDCPVLFFTLARYPSHDIVSKKEIMNKSTFKNTIKN